MPEAKKKKLLGKILQDMKVVTAEQIEEALEYQKENPGKKIGEIFIEKGWATQVQVTAALSRQYNLKFVRLSTGVIPDEIIKSVPKGVVMEHKFVPVKRQGRALTIALSQPLDMFTLDNLRFILNSDLECVIATPEEVLQTLAKYYGTTSDDISTLLDKMSESDVTVRADQQTDEDDAESAPVIKLVQLIVTEAVKARASDIHIEPMENDLRVRYRIDGVCTQVESPPKRLQPSVISRVKLMAGMDIAEKRRPQDGRIPLKVVGKEFDIRVSALPASHGESLVMRLLEKEALAGLDELGFHPDDYQRFKNIIRRPNGIFLVTGPTGSGKTTTLYAAIKELNKPNVKIITAEDPVEYLLPGVNQCRVRTSIGFTFAAIIRSMLRQAPNIILVGEIRDLETAEIAIQAALTGHLVFSTLHTNDAPSSLTRLIDMGAKPFLVSASIQAIMAQRLVRVLCPKCKKRYTPEPEELQMIGLSKKDLDGATICKPVGCVQCKNTGYKGRKGIFELMELDTTTREMVFRGEPTIKLREQAKLNGMVGLMEDGVRKVLTGITSIEEIVTLTHREDVSY